MTDIVERLGEVAVFFEALGGRTSGTYSAACDDASVLIVALRSELEQVKRDNAELHALIFEAFGGELDATQIFQERVQQAAEASLAKLNEQVKRDADIIRKALREQRDAAEAELERVKREFGEVVREMQLAIAKAELLRQEAVEALKPFEAQAKGFDFGDKKGVPDGFKLLSGLTVGHLRAARAFVEKHGRDG